FVLVLVLGLVLVTGTAPDFEHEPEEEEEEQFNSGAKEKSRRETGSVVHATSRSGRHGDRAARCAGGGDAGGARYGPSGDGSDPRVFRRRLPQRPVGTPGALSHRA